MNRLSEMSSDNKTINYYTIEEVAKQTDPNHSLWMVIDDDVLNLTEFFEKHPGGQDVLRNFAGKDATTVFHSSHSKNAKQLAKSFIIGKLAYREEKFKSNKSGEDH